MPRSTIWPSRRTTIWSACLTVEKRCETRMVVRSRITSRRRAQNPFFGFGVDARKGVVKNQNARIAQNRAGQGGALFLPAGKGDAALADQGFEFQREAEATRRCLRFPPLRRPSSSAASGDAQGDIFAEGLAEQEGVLRHKTDCRRSCRAAIRAATAHRGKSYPAARPKGGPPTRASVDFPLPVGPTMAGSIRRERVD